ncbi:MAG: ABC transporter ATP-binding protein [Alkaliphilus sp.]
MLAQIEIKNCTKKYDINIAVNSVSLSVYKGEFLAIVGPSGCGKSTLLRSIAGLETPNEGEIIIEDNLVFSSANNYNMPPEKRDVALVFQNYALWPHFSVFDNVAYPLKIRKVSKNEIKQKVHQFLSLVKLADKEQRYPHELSGGEQQRVALARALIMSPKVLLLDEPLSNLDAKLREQMQTELVKIQKSLNLTVVHVTHDQSEAMELADRIIVMNNGKISQVGTAKEIYNNPSSPFVANFIGKTNLIAKKSKSIKTAPLLFDEISTSMNIDTNEKTVLSVRPEDINLSLKYGEYRGIITRVIYHGSTIQYLVKYKNIELVVQTKSDSNFNQGSSVYFSFGRVVGL